MLAVSEASCPEPISYNRPTVPPSELVSTLSMPSRACWPEFTVAPSWNNAPPPLMLKSTSVPAATPLARVAEKARFGVVEGNGVPAARGGNVVHRGLDVRAHGVRRALRFEAKFAASLTTFTLTKALLP